jgi:hypothetical protein
MKTLSYHFHSTYDEQMSSSGTLALTPGSSEEVGPSFLFLIYSQHYKLKILFILLYPTNKTLHEI